MLKDLRAQSGELIIHRMGFKLHHSLWRSYRLVWFGLVWFGLVWFGLVWSGLVVWKTVFLRVIFN